MIWSLELITVSIATNIRPSQSTEIFHDAVPPQKCVGVPASPEKICPFPQRPRHHLDSVGQIQYLRRRCPKSWRRSRPGPRNKGWNVRVAREIRLSKRPVPLLVKGVGKTVGASQGCRGLTFCRFPRGTGRWLALQ